MHYSADSYIEKRLEENGAKLAKKVFRKFPFVECPKMALVYRKPDEFNFE